jgi:Family of unknown function (DUF6335)
MREEEVSMPEDRKPEKKEIDANDVIREYVESADTDDDPTPDQDIVDEIGRAVGVAYEDAEPLHTTEKLERRDEQRWELHPASSEDFTERNQNYDKPVAPRTAASRSKRIPSSSKRGKRKAA